jgi:hypothetical protein
MLKIVLMTLVLFMSFDSFKAQASLIYEAQKKGIKLEEEDKEILDEGEISTTRYVIGGVLGTYPIGFGVGHAIQGRWSEQGWIYTAGELGSLGVLIIGAAGCLNDELENGINRKDDCKGFNEAMIITGAIGFIGFRIWEIVDVWAGVPRHNRKYRELKDYINKSAAKEEKTSLYLNPIYHHQMGQGLGLTLRF